MKSYIEQLKTLLPYLFNSVTDIHGINEIRIRANKRPFFIYRDKRMTNDFAVDRKRFESIILALCGGNLYKHEATLPQGYFTDIFGARCGVGCNVINVNNAVKTDEIYSLNIRVPRYIPGAAKELFDSFKGKIPDGGVVIFGKPGVGKTTFIRSLAGLYADAGVCVCAVDERREFNREDYGESANIDIISGHRKWFGIEIAMRTMSPDIIICDELGAADRCGQFYDVASSGVPLVATVHAADPEKLKAKEWIRTAVSAGVFSHYVFLSEINIIKEIGSFC